MAITKKKIFIFIILVFMALVFFTFKANSKSGVEYPEFDANGQEVYLPTYMPEGYVVQDIIVNNEVITINFIYESEYAFFVQMPYYSLGMDIDKDDYYTEKTKIGGKEGYFSEYENNNIFTFYEGNHTFSVLGAFDKDEFDKIVRSIKLYNL